MENHYIKNAKWIWQNNSPQSDEYAEFMIEVPWGTDTAFICADSNYELYVNGELASFGQYADYPYDKVYDKLDLSEYFTKESNSVLIRVWYYGISDTQTYHLGRAGVKFAFFKDECCVALSSSETKSRLCPWYVSHRNKRITHQIGLGFAYDSTKEDTPWHNSVELEMTTSFRPRPIKKLVLENEVCAQLIKRLDDGALLFDLGREEVGFLHLRCKAKNSEKVTVSWGEHIVDGRVRAQISGRDFSVEYIAKSGENDFTNYFRRLGCRYIEVKGAVDSIEVGIIPTMYPLEQKPKPEMTETQQKIFDACIRTLRLCMHEHYEDCPWREQALYAMDSRNQMLCGYYAFGEYQFPKACLELMANDRHPDGLLSICPPSSSELIIPSFSMHFVTEVCEYIKYSGDKEFGDRVLPKLQSIMEVFKKYIRDGLLYTDEYYWNFYEWTTGLDDIDYKPNRERKLEHSDFVMNALYIISLDNIADVWGIDEYRVLAGQIREKAKTVFTDGENVWNRRDKLRSSELGVSLAILSGIVTGDDAVKLANNLSLGENMDHISLSMNCFKYDALLKVSSKYKEWILKDIERIYIPMLEGGTGTVWETETGESDFYNAGSLCHGWSAMPVYYYYTLLGE